MGDKAAARKAARVRASKIDKDYLRTRHMFRGITLPDSFYEELEVWGAAYRAENDTAMEEVS